MAINAARIPPLENVTSPLKTINDKEDCVIKYPLQKGELDFYVTIEDTNGNITSSEPIKFTKTQQEEATVQDLHPATKDKK